MELATLPSLPRDIRKAAATLSVGEARVLVDMYYQMQDYRIHAANQVRALSSNEEPHETIFHFSDQFHLLEKDVAKALDTYSANQPLGKWARAHVGVGPVIAAGLLAHIPISKTPSPSALWTFAGLAPDQKYVKGEKRNWNAGLKVLCWKMADSFVKQSFRDNCYYGKLYLRRKEKEVARNEAVRMVPTSTLTPDHLDSLIERGAVKIGDNWFIGGNAASALKSLENRGIKDAELKKLLITGKLPPGQLDLRARRYAVKRFLVHYWMAAWWLEYKTEPPRAYVFDQLGHVDEEQSPVPMPKPHGK